MLLGFQYSLEKDENDNSPEKEICILTVTHKLVMPALNIETMKVISNKNLDKDSKVVTRFLSQASERNEYATQKKAFDTLLQAHQTAEAEALWDNYMESTYARMPEQTGKAMQRLMSAAMAQINVDNLLDRKLLKQEIIKNPACTAYLQS